jgi:hypothetical protein
MGTRRRLLPVLMSVLIGAAVGALLARWVFGESDITAVSLIAGAAAAASGLGTIVRAARQEHRSSQ